MAIETVSTGKAPAAVGPYSQAVKAGGFLFTSGQIPLSSDGSAVAGDVRSQTRQVLENLRNVLEAAGSGLDRVVKCTCFLADMNDFAAMNDVYAEFFGSSLPARSTVQVARLPKDASVEIEAVALLSE